MQRHERIAWDLRKVQDAQQTEMDYGVGNVTQALAEHGLYERALVIFHTDNGGPPSHGCNWPHRGFKFGVWEGGVRGVAFVSGGLIPQARRGTQFDGILYVGDWYRTIVEGVAGLTLPAVTGPIAPDSVNQWPALTEGTPSTRTEVVHMPLSNAHVNVHLNAGGKASCLVGVEPAGALGGFSQGCATSFRMGDFKLLIGWPGDCGLCHLPPPADHPIPFGRTGGKLTEGDHCAGGRWLNNQTFQRPEVWPPGGNGSGCGSMLPDVVRLFEVKSSDLGEQNDLSQLASHQPIIDKMLARLRVLSADGAPMPSLSVIRTQGVYDDVIHPKMCARANRTGYWLPSDWPDDETDEAMKTDDTASGLVFADDFATLDVKCGDCKNCSGCSDRASCYAHKPRPRSCPPWALSLTGTPQTHSTRTIAPCPPGRSGKCLTFNLTVGYRLSLTAFFRRAQLGVAACSTVEVEARSTQATLAATAARLLATLARAR